MAKYTPEEDVRIYGPPGRREWVQQQPCCIPGCSRRPCDNHHTRSGGKGRKADYTTIVALCSGPYGHHQLYHTIGKKTLAKLAGVDWDEEAKNLEDGWQAFKRRYAK